MARRLEDLTDGAKGLMLNEDMEKTQQERINIFYSHVKVCFIEFFFFHFPYRTVHRNCPHHIKQKRKAEGKIETLGKEISAEAERLDIKDKAALVLSELIFDENMIQQIKTYRVLLLRVNMTSGSPSCQTWLEINYPLFLAVHP